MRRPVSPPAASTTSADAATDAEPVTAPARRAPRPRRAPTPARIKRQALDYLQRYATSAQHLRHVLARRNRLAAAEHGVDAADLAARIEAVIAELHRLGLLNDTAFAESRARSLAGRGKSKRMIGAALRQKGVDGDTIDAALARLEEEHDGEAERQSALRLAARRRLGPYRGDAEERQARYHRDMAALARAGFSADVARWVLDAPDAESLAADLAPET